MFVFGRKITVVIHYLKRKKSYMLYVFITCFIGFVIVLLLHTTINEYMRNVASGKMVTRDMDSVMDSNMPEQLRYPFFALQAHNVTFGDNPTNYLEEENNKVIVNANTEVDDDTLQHVTLPVSDESYVPIRFRDIIHIVGYIVFSVMALSSGIFLHFKERRKYNDKE